MNADSWPSPFSVAQEHNGTTTVKVDRPTSVNLVQLTPPRLYHSLVSCGIHCPVKLTLASMGSGR